MTRAIAVCAAGEKGRDGPRLEVTGSQIARKSARFIQRAVEIFKANANTLVGLIDHVDHSALPRELKRTLHKQRHTSSGVPERFGPSECEPELPGNRSIELPRKLHVNADSVTYVSATVEHRRRRHGERDRRINRAGKWNTRSSRCAA